MFVRRRRDVLEPLQVTSLSRPPEQNLRHNRPGQRTSMAAPRMPLPPRGPGSGGVRLLLVIHASEIIEGHAQRLGQTLSQFERR